MSYCRILDLSVSISRHLPDEQSRQHSNDANASIRTFCLAEILDNKSTSGLAFKLTNQMHIINVTCFIHSIPVVSRPFYYDHPNLLVSQMDSKYLIRLISHPHLGHVGNSRQWLPCSLNNQLKPTDHRTNMVDSVNYASPLELDVRIDPNSITRAAASSLVRPNQ